MSIRVLKLEVAAQIAAGEVVERPASVVKELIENSLDAGATQIVVEVKGGGLELIRVVDNGAGIPAADVETAFARHATSKITSARDLDHIHTLGFRGEALPSIASVSHLELVTRSADEVAGTRLELRHGSVTRREAASRPVGTTVVVTRLFQNVPARLKFMKSAATENGRISALVSRYSLAYPSIRFSLTIDGRASFSSPGTGDLKEALAAVYGPETAESMLVVRGEWDGVGKVSGFAGPPSVSRAQRGYITLFVNHRSIQDRRLTYAVEEAYQGLLMVGRRPVAVLELTLPPEEVDVNVHPAKNEVRFRREREVFGLVQKAVREALVESAPVPRAGIEASFTGGPASPRTPLASDLVGWARRPRADASEENAAPIMGPMKALPVLRVVGQVNNTYIVAEGPDGMYLVDQHAAHERVLFEKVLKERKERGVQAQGMLTPATVELTPLQEEGLGPLESLLQEYGFAFEAFGDRTYLLRAVPATLSDRSPGRAFVDILDSMLDAKGDDPQEATIAAVIACHSAVRAGDTLGQEEMEGLIRSLESADNPHTCPHGRPTLVHLSSSLLEREFGRR
ncbi:MAG: DNA mismatch repair endonuclease MutL [Chloroflexi bacterium]|nr:DNA mismatch repair endonuclease MutL [Chloroflexota bacterium]